MLFLLACIKTSAPPPGLVPERIASLGEAPEGCAGAWIVRSRTEVCATPCEHRGELYPQDSDEALRGRDFGPRYLEIDGELIVQNWEFDAYGRGATSSVPYANDQVNPDRVAEYLGLRTEQVNIVHERGDLEVNGKDTAIVNWSVLSHRNPQMGREEMTAGLEQALGVTSVIYVEGFFLVGDGYVLVGDSGIQADNRLARTTLEQTFRGREVRFVNVDALWANGGGIHCVTNDQPESL